MVQQNTQLRSEETVGRKISRQDNITSVSLKTRQHCENVQDWTYKYGIIGYLITRLVLPFSLEDTCLENYHGQKKIFLPGSKVDLESDLVKHNQAWEPSLCEDR